MSADNIYDSVYSEVISLMRIIPLALILAALIHGAAPAQTIWTVQPDGSGDAPTISAAIDSAASGDRIIVYAGWYTESGLVVDGKDLTFQYQGGIPIIVSSGTGVGTGITFRNTGPGTSILGFEFRDYDTAVSIEDSDGTYWYLTIRYCNTGVSISGVSSAPTVMFSLVDSCGTGIGVSGGSGVSIRNMTIVNAEAGIESLGGSATVSRSIIYGCDTGAQCSGGALTLSCNNFHLNTADYGGCAAGPDDFYDQTLFCLDAGGSPGPYYLDDASPCWAANNTCGVDMGAFTQSAGCTGTATEETSWGAIKKMYH